MRIALSTGGGDAPGLNAVIRAAVLSARTRGWDVLGIKRGFAGLMGDDEVIPLTADSVKGIASLGGTILRTTNRGSPFAYPVQQPDGTWKEIDRSDELVENARNLGIEAIISIGGDGSLAIASRLQKKGMRIICVPKTIDNDVAGTVTTFGFDTAVNTAMEAIDKLHTTAESHDRVMVLEVMGRDAGFIALHAGVAGSADVILIPEIAWDIELVCEKVMANHIAGRLSSIVVVAEGSKPKGGTESIIGASLPGQDRRLGASRNVWAMRFRSARARRRARSCSDICNGAARRLATIDCWPRDSAPRRSRQSLTKCGARWSPCSRRIWSVCRLRKCSPRPSGSIRSTMWSRRPV